MRRKHPGVTGECLLTHRRATIRHQLIQFLLCLFGFEEITGLQHLTFIPYHLVNIHGVVPAVIRTIEINSADKFFLVRKFL